MSNDREIVRSFVSAIFLQALKDWVKPRKAKVAKYKNVKHFKISKSEILEFLNSKWCEFLCSTIDLTPETILHKLTNDDFYADLLMEQQEQM